MPDEVLPSEQPTVYRTVQTALQADAPGPEAVAELQTRVLAWAREKWPEQVPPDRTFTARFGGTELEAMRQELTDGWRWRFRSRHPDGTGDPRDWVTECVLQEQEGRLRLALRNAVWLRASARPPQPSIPRLLTELVSVCTWREPGGFTVRTTPTLLDSDSRLDEFIAQALSEDRTLPLVVMSETNRANPVAGAYVPSPVTLANAVAGVAHVVCVPLASQRALALELGPDLAPKNGVIRVLAPQFTLADTSRRHALVAPATGAWAAELPALNWLRRTLIASVTGICVQSEPLTREVNRLLGPG